MVVAFLALAATVLTPPAAAQTSQTVAMTSRWGMDATIRVENGVPVEMVTISIKDEPYACYNNEEEQVERGALSYSVESVRLENRNGRYVGHVLREIDGKTYSASGDFDPSLKEGTGSIGWSENRGGGVSCLGSSVVDLEGPGIGAVPPTASIAYRGAGNANEFVFDASGSTAVPPAEIERYEWTFPDGTKAGRVVTHEFSAPGQHEVTLRVTDSAGGTATATTTLTPKLSISQVVPDPDPPTGSAPFDLRVTVRNDGGVPIDAVVPTVAFDPPTIATIARGPEPPSADLAAGTSRAFVFTVTPGGKGEAAAVVDASGAGPEGTVEAEQRVRRFSLGDELLPIELSVKPAYVGVGGTTKVRVKVANETGHPITSLAPTLSPAPKAGVALTGPTGGTGSLPRGGSTTFQYGLEAANKGEVVLTATARARVPFNDTTAKGGPAKAKLQVGTPTVVVTTTGNEGLPADAKAGRVCDVDEDAPGRQCTLRAAIELANAWREVKAVAIQFDIPSEGAVPRIALPPVTSNDEIETHRLPPIEKTVYIDGSTQPGGWVEVAALERDGLIGSGIHLKGPGSSVRGMVVNGFGVGIRISGKGAVVAGNRIGVDATGTSQRGNAVGIGVEATGVSIGGVAGTSVDACTGDCNLVAGNSLAQIVGGVRPPDTEFGWPYGTDGPVAGLRIQGNWMGTTSSGAAPVPQGIGIRINSEPGLPASHAPLIGGRTSRPGTAPGNLIVSQHDDAVAASGVVVQGNIVGLDKTGKHDLIPASDASLQPSGIFVHSSLVGGTAPGAGNLVGGFGGAAGISATGTAASPSRVVGNRVGTDITGTIPVANHVGVWVGATNAAEVRVDDNLISGNDIGVSGDRVITVGHGNFIGTTPDGRSALPNGVGVAGDHPRLPDRMAPHTVVVGPLAGACPSVPCNLISGNTGAGIDLDNVGTLSIAGAYVGTDASGSRALPNGGAGIDVRGYQPANVAGEAPAAAAWEIGGASRVLTSGKCVFPCNVIAGNDGPGISVSVLDGKSLVSPNVAGNLVGVGGNGKPLPNGGPALDATGTGGSFKLLVGGDLRTGNVLLGGAAAAVQVHAVDGAAPRLTLRSNRFRMDSQSAFTIVTPDPPAPAISSVSRDGSQLLVTGSTNATLDPLGPAETVELYSSSSCEAGEDPREASPLGVVVKPNKVTGAFTALVPRPASGTFITALRTSLEGRTSRFAGCFAAG